MKNSKPKTVQEYEKWLCEKHNIEKISISRPYYESVSNKMLMTFKSSNFWESLQINFKRLSQEFSIKTGYHLFSNDDKPEMKIKPFVSFIQKTFRKNVIDNSNWPDEPKGGWLLPQNWYSRINDIIRTMFVVKYLDGVAFLVESLSSKILPDFGMECRVDFEAREEGYYAAHLHTDYECEIPKEDWDTKKINATFEMQITTQLQEIIKNLLHKYYETKRIRTKISEIKWQWDYESEEFATNYLGHILHYVEGMIMEIREKQKEC